MVRTGQTGFSNTLVSNSSVRYAQSPEDIMVVPVRPETMSRSSSSRFDETTSSYFSGGASSKRTEDGYIGASLTLFEELNETPGPGYSSFAQHVMNVDGASTPVNAHAQSPITGGSFAPIATTTINAMRKKLEFGRGQTNNSPNLTLKKVPRKQTLGRNNVNIHDSSIVDLRLKPGESGLLSETVLKDASLNLIPRSKTPSNLVSTPPSQFTLPNGCVVQVPQQRRTPQQQTQTSHPSSIAYHDTQELIIRPPVGNIAGMKQIKLKDNFSIPEFVDLLLNQQTFSWDILADPITNHKRVIFYQEFK